MSAGDGGTEESTLKKVEGLLTKGDTACTEADIVKGRKSKTKTAGSSKASIDECEGWRGGGRSEP